MNHTLKTYDQKVLNTLNILSHKYPAIDAGIIEEKTVSQDGLQFHVSDNDDIVAFSRKLDGEEALIVYNPSTVEAKEEYIMLDHKLHKNTSWLKSIYGHVSNSHTQVIHKKINGLAASFVKLYLQPGQLVVLKNG